MKKVLQENMKETKVAKSKAVKTENTQVVGHSLLLGSTSLGKSMPAVFLIKKES